MHSDGTSEARTHLTRPLERGAKGEQNGITVRGGTTPLPPRLERVAKGERIVFTVRGKPVAMLVPPELGETVDDAEVGRAMLAYRDRVNRRLGGSFRDLAHEGHRY